MEDFTDYIGGLSHRKVFLPSNLVEVVDWAREVLKDEKLSAIAATGHSGLIVAGAISYATDLPVVAVRRPGDVPIAHSYFRIEGLAAHGKRWMGYVFVDDMIASGSTYRNVVELIGEKPKLVLLYDDVWTTSYDDVPVRRMVQ